MAQIEKVVIKSIPDDPNLQISLKIAGKQRNLDRPKSETLEKPLTRIQKSAAPPPDKKQRRQAPLTDPSSITESLQASQLLVALHEGPTADHPLLDPSQVTNEEAWQHGRLLRIGDVSYIVHRNPPTLEKLETYGLPFVGIPIVPSAKLHFSNVEDCIWQWQRLRKSESTTPTISNSRNSSNSNKTHANNDALWEDIPHANQRIYTPTDTDVKCMLRVTCTPTQLKSKNDIDDDSMIKKISTPGTSTTTITTNNNNIINITADTDTDILYGDSVTLEIGPIISPPSPSSSGHRHTLTPTFLTGSNIRVMTYNLLADQYASTTTARDVLFSSCPPECLDPGYRRPLLLSEILGYHADIICLQEVDDKMFSMCLDPVLSSWGYQGIYTNKAGKVREGSAMFWKKDRFTLVVHKDIVLKDLFPTTHTDQAIHASTYGTQFASMLKTSPALCSALQKVGTVGQIALLYPTASTQSHDRLAEDIIISQRSRGEEGREGEQPLCIINTHLFFHYAAPHIRTMHVWALLQEASKLLQDHRGGGSSGDNNNDEYMLDPGMQKNDISVLFCGDLNSDLNDGIPGTIELLSEGYVPHTYWDWSFGVDFRWEKESQEESQNDDEVLKMVHTEIEHKHPTPATDHIVPGIDLSSPFKLSSADNLSSELTNYVKGYQGLLDYIWYQPEAMTVERIIPLPSKEELGGYIPSRRFPSDHLPVVAELKFKHHHSSSSSSPSSPSCSPPLQIPEGPLVVPAAMHNVGIAAKALDIGGVLILPTDTLYGIAACALSDKAVQRIYLAKKREQQKPLAICVADYKDVSRYVDTEHLPRGLLQELLPGPVTIVLDRKSDAPLSKALNPGIKALAVRIPDSKFIRAVCRQHQNAIALTSANVSGALSPVSVDEVDESQMGCDALFDGGELKKGREGSTIVDLSQKGEFIIVRKGSAHDATVELLNGKYSLSHKIVP